MPQPVNGHEMQSDGIQQESDERIAQEYKRRRNRQLITTILAFLAVICVGYWAGIDPQTSTTRRYMLPQIAMIVLGAGVLASSLLYWRCPVCNKWLGNARPISRGGHKFCKKCGTQLR